MIHKYSSLYVAAIFAEDAVRIREVLPDVKFFSLLDGEPVKPHKEYPGNPAHFEHLREDER